MLSPWERFWLRVAYRQEQLHALQDRVSCFVWGHQPKMKWCRRCGADNHGKWRKRGFGRWR